VSDFFGFFIRTFSFLSKEIVEILRQPSLILTLILGPFLILLLFGIGYSNEARPLRTYFVVPEDSGLRATVEEQVTAMGPQLVFAGITASENEARLRLQQNEVDVVTIVPGDAYETIRNSQQAVFILLHNQIDPLEAEYVRVFGQVYVDEVNRRVLQTITEEGQRDAGSLQQSLQSARANAAATREALDRGERALAAAHALGLRRDVGAVDLLVGGSLALLGGVQQVTGSNGNPTSDVAELMTSLRRDTSALNDESIQNDAGITQQVEQVESELAQLEAELAEFQQIDANVLVSPFRSEVNTIAPLQLNVVDYYAPSVIILLLQHFGVTFAGLSIVRERRSGSMELFRVAPISAFETIIGKYMSYLLFIGIIAAILTALLIFGLGTPLLGDWTLYGLILLALIFTSLGYGFILSLISETTSQAVQYSMILLLASVFFTGFFLSLEMLWEPVRIISWILPATYGIQLLQNVMLRGVMLDWNLLIYLSAIGLFVFLMAWTLLHQQMARQ
jgi:ABC-2 type transport system permease protein